MKQYLLQGYSFNRQMVALQQHVDDRLLKIKDRLDRQQEDIDFYIKTNQQPSELVIPTGCVWDAYSYLSDLVRTAKGRVILIDNFVDDRTFLLFAIGMLIVKTGDVSYLVFLLVYGVDGCLTICHRIILHEDLGQAHRKHMYQLMSNELGMPHPV